MINTPQVYWHLGTADNFAYATEIAEKYMETARDGGYKIEKVTKEGKVFYQIFAQEGKK